mgnify:CR=1 FL=1
MILHGYFRSSAAWRVRIALALKGLRAEDVFHHLRKGEQRSTEYLALNPQGFLPTLVLDDGTALTQSMAIVEYLDETVPTPPLMPAMPAERHEVRRLCAWFDDKFNIEVTRPILSERVWKKVMNAGYPDSRLVKSGLRAVKDHMDYLGHLLEHRKWLGGNMLTLADFTAAAHISCLDYISDVDWTHSTEVQEWYAKIKSRPAFRSLLAELDTME